MAVTQSNRSQSNSDRSSPRIIMGIDPGFDRLGWAVGTFKANQWSNLHFGCIQTAKKDALYERFKQLNQEFAHLVALYQPTEAALESLFFIHNQSTAFAVSQARGVVLASLLPVVQIIADFTPLQVKQSVTGFGKADKSAVAKMVRVELQLGNQPIIDDAFDALAVMITQGAAGRIARL